VKVSRVIPTWAEIASEVLEKSAQFEDMLRIVEKLADITGHSIFRVSGAEWVVADMSIPGLLEGPEFPTFAQAFDAYLRVIVSKAQGETPESGTDE